MATPNIVPRADSEGGLGTASKYWASAYIDLIYLGAGKIGRDADNLIDFSVDDKIQFEVAGSIRSQMTSGNFFPNTNDSLALGAAGYGFSDLFLASGAVINFDNSNVTLTHSSNKLTLADSDVLAFGTGSDLQIYHDGSAGVLFNSTGNFFISQTVTDADMIFKCDDGSGGTAAYLTLDGGLGWTVASKNIQFSDSIKASFGSSVDMIIQHNGTNSYIENATGDLEIINGQDDGDIIFKSDDGSGGVTPYLTLDGSAARTVFSRETLHSDNVKGKFGSSGDLQIYHDSSHSYIAQSGTGDLYIQQSADDKDIYFQSDNGAGGVANYFYLDGSSATHDGSATTALYTNWPDKSRISLGTSHDIYMYHDGSNTWFENQTGDLTFRNSANDKDIIFQSDDGSGGVETYFFLDGSLDTDYPATVFPDASRLYFGTGLDFNINHNGVSTFLSNNVGDLSISNSANDKDIIFNCDDGSGGVTAYLTLDGGVGYTVAQKTIRVVDNQKIQLGGSGDLNILHDATDSWIINDTGDLYIRNSVDDKDIIFQSDNGSGGVQTYFRLDGSALVTNFPDNSKLTVGDGNDLQIYHNATNSFIQNETGHLGIINYADDKNIILQCDDGSGGVTPYLTLDGSASRLNVPDNIQFTIGTGIDSKMYHNGTNTYFENVTGDWYFDNHSNDKDMIFRNDDGSGGVETYFFLDGSQANTNFTKDVIFGDNKKALFGGSGDLQIYHDGSNSYIKDTGTGRLRFQAATQIDFLGAATGETMANMIENGAVKLYHNNVKTFETTATGISVTGATGTTEGGGIDATDAVSIKVGEINGEIITTIFVDIGVGSIQSSSTNTGAIGNGTDAAAYITRVTTAINGIVYKVELICVEAPTVASGALSADFDLTANASSIASGSAVSGSPICNSAGDHTLGRFVRSTDSTTNTITPNDYLYLAQGNTNAGVYNAGKFLIRLYGAKTTGL